MTQKKNVRRCAWVSNDPLYITYHDIEWGVPQHDDTTQFEFLILEGMQAGLSWLTVLRKRENYRQALDGFDYHKIANYKENKVDELLHNEGIIRNKLKIASIIQNAKAFLAVQKAYGSFGTYIWQFVQNKPIQHTFHMISEIPSKTEISDALSKDLRKRGFNFVGSTICYAHMQATGMVNDHTTDCFRYKELFTD
ncbi:MAG TPA: DNA-3-methyladenine glycosylase I [Candidatus Acidoferrales bacterium]|nr:DNA-3-methyladenine glycosylase I [Candidatus Acidoferrales bacterium]